MGPMKPAILMEPILRYGELTCATKPRIEACSSHNLNNSCKSIVLRIEKLRKGRDRAGCENQILCANLSLDLVHI